MVQLETLRVLWAKSLERLKLSRLEGLLQRPVILESVFLAGFFLAGALLRMLYLDDIPPGFAGDESVFGINALRIEKGWNGVFGFCPECGQPTGSAYWAALFFRFLPNDVLTLRLSFAVIGVLTIPFFYLFCRELYGRTVALIGAFLLTFSYWHVHYSRPALPMVFAPLAVSLVFLAMGYGLRTGKAWPFVVAGLIFAAGVYTYSGYWFFLPVVGALWLFLLIQRLPLFRKGQVRDESLWSRLGPFRLMVRNLILFALFAFLLAIPMLDLYNTRPDLVTGYAQGYSIFNSPEWDQATGLEDKVELIARHLRRGMSIYYEDRGPDYVDGFTGIAVLDRLTMVLFTVGLAVSLWRARHWQYLAILLSIAAGVVAVAVTTPTFGQTRRGIVALPLVYAAAGIGAEALLTGSRLLWEKLAPRRFPRVSGLYRIAYPILGAALGFSAFVNVNHYFDSKDDMKFAFAYELREATEYLKDLPGNPYVYWYSDRWFFDYDARCFQAPHLRGEDRFRQANRVNLDYNPKDGAVVFLLMDSYQTFVGELQKRYNGHYVEKRQENGSFVFGAYLVEGDRAAAPTASQNCPYVTQFR